MGTTVEDLRVQHKHACDKIVHRLEMKSSRGEGPSRVLRKTLKHFDKTDGQLMLSATDFLQAMERIGTKLSPSDLDLLLTLYSLEGADGFDGRRFVSDLFGEGGASSSTVSESGLVGGMFTADRSPHAAPKARLSSNTPSLPGGPLTGGMPPPQPKQAAYYEPRGEVDYEQMQQYVASAPYDYPPEPSPAPQQKKQSNTSSVPGGIFGGQPETQRSLRATKNNVSSVPGGARVRAAPRGRFLGAPAEGRAATSRLPRRARPTRLARRHLRRVRPTRTREQGHRAQSMA